MDGALGGIHPIERAFAMLKKSAAFMLVLASLAACSTPQPKIIQAASGMQEIRLTVGMATQLEMPEAGRVQSVAVGNPALVTAEQASDVVSLIAKGGEGETNLIVRSRDEDGKVHIYQYRLIVHEK